MFQGSIRESDVREFSTADGLPGTESFARFRSIVTDPLGRIWLSLNGGIAVANPSTLSHPPVPALVHIESISGDGRLIDKAGRVRVPPDVRRVTIGFAGLSLATPERVRYRYRLDGYDRDWSEPTASREAAYTNLGPGPYRFRVIASNSEGVWDSAEAVAGFDVEPSFWQTWWFRSSVVAACALCIVLVYRFRLQQVTRNINLRFEERLGERTRIAQELHDTLLQGFLSASMQLDVAVDSLPPDSAVRPRLARVLELMRQVVDEGRNAVRGLRSSNSAATDLAKALSEVRGEFQAHAAGFRVLVEGRPTPLIPVVGEEAYRIGREALVNAFRHSKARNIEVEIEYTSDRVRVRVRDDGCGIDPKVVKSGREGHWGLPGMHERAEQIGARLTLWSRPNSGTEVELSIPARVAFESRAGNTLTRWVGWVVRLGRNRSAD